MESRFSFTIFALIITAGSGEVKYTQYNAEAVRRFDVELRNLGVTVSNVTIPEEPLHSPPPKVSSSAGEFEGFWIKSQFGRPIAAFEGIPYAQPPVGLLRFKVAQPANRLASFNATKPGSKCVQRVDFYGKNPTITGEEDCLFINIYVPEKTQRTGTEILPVIFFIHGGTFVMGEGQLYKSHVLLDKDVVLVTFNYRLGPLGFFTTGDQTIPGNLGLKDQVAALQWVRTNIASFGGDPNLITIMGHSAGAISGELIMLSPVARGLFHKVISMSGSSLSPYAVAPPEEAEKHRRIAIEKLGCPKEPSGDLLTCLQNKPAEEIASVELNFVEWGTILVPFKPIIEGEVLGALISDHPKKLFSHSLVDVPHLSGVTSEEGSFFSTGIFTNETLLEEFNRKFTQLAPPTLSLTQPHEKTDTVLQTLRRAYFGPKPFTKSNLIDASNLYTDIYWLWPAIQTEIYHRKYAKSPSYFSYFSYKSNRSFMQLFGFPDSYVFCDIYLPPDASFQLLYKNASLAQVSVTAAEVWKIGDNMWPFPQGKS